MKDPTLFDTIDPGLLNHYATRRNAVGSVLKLGAATLTAPLMLATLAGNAHGENKDIHPGVFSVLRFALLLERLEHDFYKQGMETKGLIPPAHREIFETVRRHEAEHVKLLGTATLHITETDDFDFTAGGKFPDVFSNYKTFLALSQCFEDTGVRAYKGQATNLMSVGALLTIALTIHSVEARHAAEIRRLRGEKAWITGSSRGSLPAFAQPIYDGNGVSHEAGVSLAGIDGTREGAASEAFDEPLSRSQVLAIVRPFVVKSSVIESSS